MLDQAGLPPLRARSPKTGHLPKEAPPFPGRFTPDIATVFLDNMLHVRRFNSQATKIFKFIPTDIGRPLADIVHKLDYRDLQNDAQEVLRTLAFSEKQISSNDGYWYIVRIMPYRTLENVIDGVVITLIDISDAKRLEAELRAARTALPDNQQPGPKP